MANYATLKAAVADVIKTNGDNEITGAILQQTLLSIIDSLGAGYQFAGVAEPSTNPGTPDQRIFYITKGSGNFANFGPATIREGEVAILRYSGAWEKISTNIADNETINRALFGNEGFIANGYINANGVYVAYSSPAMMVTDYIPVGDGDVLDYSLSCNGATIVACYDKDKNFLPSKSISDNTGTIHAGTITFDGVSFVRITNYFPTVPDPLKKFTTTAISKRISDITKQFNDVLPNIQGIPISYDLDMLGFIRQSGQFVETEQYRSSDYIGVIPGITVKYSGIIAGTNCIIASYDVDKTFLPNDSVYKPDVGTYTGEITLGENVAFIRLCNYLGSLTTGSFQLVMNKNVWPAIIENRNVLVKAKQIVDERELFRLWDSIKRPIVFSGKTMVAFGDSITAGVSSPGLVTITDSYIKLFADYAGIGTLDNRAVSGSTIVPRGGGNDIYNRIVGYNGNASVFWIAGGTNDWNTGQTLGQFGDTGTGTFYGALDSICQFLQTNYPNATVIFVTPIPYTRPASVWPNHNGELNSYRTAIYDVATYYGYNVVDGNNLGMPHELGGWNNTMVADTDGCHPTARGHALYARSLTGKLL